MFGSSIMAGEKCIFSVQSQGPDGTLNRVGVHLDAAIVGEQDKTVPVVEGIADGLGHFGAAGNEGRSFFEPGFELFKEGPALGLADLEARFGALSAARLFDFVERRDLNERLLRLNRLQRKATTTGWTAMKPGSRATTIASGMREPMSPVARAVKGTG
jgi:hypothetical protein